MNETQHDHFVGHILPGVFLLLLSALLHVVFIFDKLSGTLAPTKAVSASNPFAGTGRTRRSVPDAALIILGGVVLVGFVVFVAILGVDEAAGKDTRQHRVLTLVFLPLGFACIPRGLGWVNGDREFWRFVLGAVCLLNAVLYYFHRHPAGETMDTMNGSPTPEEDAHVPLYLSFLGAGIAFLVSLLFPNTRVQTDLNLFGCAAIATAGVWYLVIAVILYGGAYGVDGINYSHTFPDFGLTCITVLSAYTMGRYAVGVHFNM